MSVGERAMLGTCSLPGTGLRDGEGSEAENSTGAWWLRRAGGEGPSRPELRRQGVEAASSGRMLCSWHFFAKCFSFLF